MIAIAAAWIGLGACSGPGPRATTQMPEATRPSDTRPVEPANSATVSPEVPVAALDKGPKPPEASRPVEAPPPPETARPAEPASLPGPLAQILDAHNRYRARHCAPPLEWSAEIARGAQAWVDELVARGCAFAHSGTRLGENLAGATEGSMDGRGVVDLWYSERAGYDFRRPGYSPQSGHFTQVVWVSSRRIGCGRAVCRGTELWVCQYDPAGNMEGAFDRNVLSSCP